MLSCLQRVLIFCHSFRLFTIQLSRVFDVHEFLIATKVLSHVDAAQATPAMPF